MTNATPVSPSPVRVAYLLADAGITLWDSKKGCSIHARSMIRAFEQEGCAVDVYVMREGNKRACGQDFGPRVRVKCVRQSRLTRWWQGRVLDKGFWRRLVPGGRAAAAPPNWMQAVGWLLWHRDFYRAAERGCKKNPPGLIYARSGWFSWPYARLKERLRVPMFLEVNCVFTIEKKDRGENAWDGLSARVEEQMFHAADQILPVSDLLKEQIASMGIPPEKIVVTPNAVDLELFSPAKPEDKPAGRFLVGAVNSMRAYHGMGTLLRAARVLRERIPGFGLLLIGGGFTFDQVKQEARELGVDDITEFTGIIDHSQVPVRLRECSACAAPYEGEVNQYNCPMKLYEYMGLKVPIVASDWGDIPNIITHGKTALLHAPADPQALAAAIEQIWADPQAAQVRAETAYELAQDHTWRTIARRLLAAVQTEKNQNKTP